MDAHAPESDIVNPRGGALLSRTIRFAVNPDGSTFGPNGFAGRPAMRGLGRFYEMTFALRGEPDARTGYIVGIQEIDAAARSAVLPLVAGACRDTPTAEPAALMPGLWDAAARAMPRPLARMAWTLTPTYAVEMTVDDRTGNRVQIRQSFDFAAAHRLHSPDLSDEQNRSIFGKCNNPSGHGHNYRVEPVISVPVSEADRFDLAAFEEVVERAVIDPFDHKHLNTDTTDFDQTRGGVMPSVERIAMVCHERLAGPVRDLLPGAELLRVTVWETDRTSCTYPG